MYLSQWLLCPEYVLSRGFYSTEAKFLDEIQTKVLRVFLLAILSHLYSFALRFIFLQIHATSNVFIGCGVTKWLVRLGCCMAAPGSNSTQHPTLRPAQGSQVQETGSAAFIQLSSRNYQRRCRVHPAHYASRINNVRIL
jgi:hypothetical protein